MNENNFIDMDTFLNSLPKPIGSKERTACDYSDILDDFSAMLAQYQIDHNLLQKDLAKRLKIDEQTLSQYESGRLDLNLNTVCQISNILGYRVKIAFYK